MHDDQQDNARREGGDGAPRDGGGRRESGDNAHQEPGGGAGPDTDWTTVSSRALLRHPFLDIDIEEVRLPDGSVIADWHRVHARDYVNAVVLDPSGRALVVSGYKHGIGRSSWQILGGYLEPGEDALTAAQRELREETGYVAGAWQALGSFVVDANRHVGTGHFFLARDAEYVTEPAHTDLEAFEILWVEFEEVRRALHDGRIAGLGYAAGIALALEHL